MKGTIKSKDDVERLFRKGRRSSSYLMTVLSAPASEIDGLGRCAFIAGKKLGPAPVRNRCKRVIRHVAAELGAPWEGHDVVFVARRGVASANHEECVSAMRKLLQKAGIL